MAGRFKKVLMPTSVHQIYVGVRIGDERWNGPGVKKMVNICLKILEDHLWNEDLKKKRKDGMVETQILIMRFMINSIRMLLTTTVKIISIIIIIIIIVIIIKTHFEGKIKI